MECHSKYEIRIWHLLGGVSFGFVHWCSAYIRHLCYVVSLLPVSVRLVQRLSYNNIFAVQKKNRQGWFHMFMYGERWWFWFAVVVSKERFVVKCHAAHFEGFEEKVMKKVTGVWIKKMTMKRTIRVNLKKYYFYLTVYLFIKFISRSFSNSNDSFIFRIF
jgi:hypothetical protein